MYSCRLRQSEPSNIVEGVNTVGCVKQIGRDPDHWDHRLVIATDNQALTPRGDDVLLTPPPLRRR